MPRSSSRLAQTIGVPSMNRRSPVNTVALPGTCTIVSPPVCAGPSSISETSRSPTRRSSRPSNVCDGGRTVIPS